MKSNSSEKNSNRQISKGVFEIWKKRAETLSGLLERFRFEEKINMDIPITYAGRLDPMADGVVILLSGGARFEKEEYMSLDKVYEFKVLFGMSTDTYDVLGMVTNSRLAVAKISDKKIKEAIEKIKNIKLPYPPFSSKTVKGKPLFSYAREGNLPENLPTQGGAPKSLEMIEKEMVLLGDTVDKIIADIKRVEGDFRQEEIIAGWNKLKSQNTDAGLLLATFKATVPSGVYIRSIADRIGQEIGVPSLAYSITRTKILR